MSETMNKRDISKGFSIALPIILGYFPVAFAFGILAVNAGFSPPMVGLMSFLVYAGSGQLIAVEATGGDPQWPGVDVRCAKIKRHSGLRGSPARTRRRFATCVQWRTW